MKIEVRCGGCGKGYLVDEAKIPADGGFVPCQSCGTTIPLKARTASAPPSPSPASVPAVAEADRAGEVCCPRCNFHFVLRGSSKKPRVGGRPKLLVVEDMEFFLQIARDALAERYDLKIARTVDEARVELIRGGIDLLLLDLTLANGEDGLQLLRESPGKTCPVLLFTAQDESEMYGEGWAHLRALGVDDVIIKGMNMDEALLRKVAEMLGQPIPQDSYRR